MNSVVSVTSEPLSHHGTDQRLSRVMVAASLIQRHPDRLHDMWKDRMMTDTPIPPPADHRPAKTTGDTMPVRVANS
jgi:hypothetical protein